MNTSGSSSLFYLYRKHPNFHHFPQTKSTCLTANTSLYTLTRVALTAGESLVSVYRVSVYPHPLARHLRKVAFLLNELGLSYETIYLDFQKKEQKSPEYLKVNPNGRIPALVDHKNNDFIVWYERSCSIFRTNIYAFLLIQGVLRYSLLSRRKV